MFSWSITSCDIVRADAQRIQREAHHPNPGDERGWRVSGVNLVHASILSSTGHKSDLAWTTTSWNLPSSKHVFQSGKHTRTQLSGSPSCQFLNRGTREPTLDQNPTLVIHPHNCAAGRGSPQPRDSFSFNLSILKKQMKI